MMRPPSVFLGTAPKRALTSPYIRSSRLLNRRYQSSSPGDKGASSSTKLSESEAIPVPNTVAPLPLWQRLGPLTTLASAYARAQRRRPWGTQVVSAIIIYGIADLSAQSLASDNDIDLERTARSVTIGGMAAIPSYKWFIWLSNHFNFSSKILSLATKILVSQSLFAPTFNAYFFGAQALLSGSSIAGAIDRIVSNVPTSWVNSCQFWPFWTAVTFWFIPMEYRAVFSGVIAMFWQTWLAVMNRRAERSERARGSGSLQEPSVSPGGALGKIDA